MPAAEYIRGGTAKLLTLSRLAAGAVRAKGATNAPNLVLHPWLQNELLELWAVVPDTRVADSELPTPERSMVDLARTQRGGWCAQGLKTAAEHG